MHRTATLRRIAEHRQLYVFLLLPIAYILIFHYAPMYGAQIAFRKYRALDGITGSEWVGLANFIKFFKNYQFKRVLINTLTISCYGLIANLPVTLVFALLLNAMRVKRLKKCIQTITYIPHFISTVVLVGIIMRVVNPQTGLYGAVSMAVMGRAGTFDVMGSASAFPHLFVWTAVWQKFGWNSIIYIAALTSVSPEIHEAAQIDGATRFQRLLHVDLPEILPTAVIMLILSAGQIMNLDFEKTYLMQNSLNISASETINTYVYKIAFKSQFTDFSYSTAIGLFNSVVNMLLLFGVNAVSGRISNTSIW